MFMSHRTYFSISLKHEPTEDPESRRKIMRKQISVTSYVSPLAAEIKTNVETEFEYFLCSMTIEIVIFTWNSSPCVCVRVLDGKWFEMENPLFIIIYLESISINSVECIRMWRQILKHSPIGDDLNAHKKRRQYGTYRCSGRARTRVGISSEALDKYSVLVFLILLFFTCDAGKLNAFSW